jgi:hypothetical protein
MVAAIKAAVAVFKSIIDLLMLRKNEKRLDQEIAKGRQDAIKSDLEIDKLRSEKAKTESLLIMPDHVSVEDIQKYDPRAKRIAEIAAGQSAKPPGSIHPPARVALIWIVILLAFIGYGAYRLIRLAF